MKIDKHEKANELKYGGPGFSCYTGYMDSGPAHLFCFIADQPAPRRGKALRDR